MDLTSHGPGKPDLNVLLCRQLPALVAFHLLPKACHCAGKVDSLQTPVQLTLVKFTLKDKLRHLEVYSEQLCGMCWTYQFCPCSQVATVLCSASLVCSWEAVCVWVWQRCRQSAQPHAA